MHRARMPAIDISVIGTKRRHLELKIVFQDQDHTKMRPDGVRPRKKPLHNFGSGVGGNVEIFRYLATNDVPDATASEIRDMTALP